MLRLSNMVRFILGVIGGSLKVSNRKRADVIGDLVSMGFDRIGGKKVGPCANAVLDTALGPSATACRAGLWVLAGVVDHLPLPVVRDFGCLQVCPTICCTPEGSIHRKPKMNLQYQSRLLRSGYRPNLRPGQALMTPTTITPHCSTRVLLSTPFHSQSKAGAEVLMLLTHCANPKLAHTGFSHYPYPLSQ